MRRVRGVLTSRLRVLPDFLVIGAQRAGTTSVYRYLTQHPMVMPALMKEVHFFDNNFHKGMPWYRAFFPLARRKRQLQRQDGMALTGEATPYYLFHPHAPARVKAAIPQVKLIVILRNPVDRAYSHYHHEVHMGLETLSFEEALAREERQLACELDRMLEDEWYRSFFLQNYTYLARSIYVDQLERWSRLFDREQMLVMNSEAFSADPATGLSKLADFLNLPVWQPEEYRRYHLAHYAPMNPATRQRLEAYFDAHNRRLYEHLEVDWSWEDQ